MSNVSISRRGKVWQYRFDAVNPDGTRKQISKSGYRTRKEASEAGIEALALFNKTNFVVDSQGLYFAEYIDTWFSTYCVNHTRYTTQLHHTRVINAHIKPCLGQYKLEDMSTALIQDFVNSLIIAKTSNNYIREIISLLSFMFKYAIKPMKLIRENPCDGLILPKKEINSNRKTPRYIITGSTYKKILDRFSDDLPAKIPIMLGYQAGLRMGEAFGLSWDDIDFENKELHIRYSAVHKAKNSTALNYIARHKVVSNTYGWYLGPTKTDCSIRTIQVDDILITALKEAKEAQEAARETFGEFYKVLYRKTESTQKGEPNIRLMEVEQGVPVLLEEANMVCVDEYGSYLSYERFKKYVRIIREELKIKFNYHSLRHSHATILIQEGANIKDVQERLGHSSPEITWKIYTHNTPEMKSRSISLLTKHLKQHAKL